MKHVKKKKKYGIRKFINDIHLWLGIGSGIILFLVCLSGTFLAFEHEIEAFFTEKVVVQPDQNKKTISEINHIVNEQVDGEIMRLTIPISDTDPYEYRIKTGPKDRRGTSFLADPYAGKVIKAPESDASGFMFFMFKMHRWLLLDTGIGRPIVGIATIIFIILSISGIVLWFPKKIKWKTLKNGFKIKTNANWKRINHDLHNTLGFYACIFLVIMGLTGLCWSFEGYRSSLSNVLGAKVFGNRGGGPSYEVNESSTATITFDEAVDIAQKTYPYKGKTTVSFPSEKNKTYAVYKYDESAWSPSAYNKIVIDVYGNVLDKENFNEKPLNVQIASTIRPIHTGEIFGTFSKTIYFLACLIATSLPITGTLIWVNKMKKKK